MEESGVYFVLSGEFEQSFQAVTERKESTKSRKFEANISRLTETSTSPGRGGPHHSRVQQSMTDVLISTRNGGAPLAHAKTIPIKSPSMSSRIKVSDRQSRLRLVIVGRNELFGMGNIIE